MDHFSFLSFSLLLKICLSLRNKCKPDEGVITFLKPKQVDCLMLSITSEKKAKDMMIVLGTGYGKSVLLELIPILYELHTSESPITLVMCPLNAIISQQLSVIGKDAKLLRASKY